MTFNFQQSHAIENILPSTSALTLNESIVVQPLPIIVRTEPMVCPTVSKNKFVITLSIR